MRDSTLEQSGAADDAFDLAIVNAAVLMLMADSTLLWLGFTSPAAIGAMGLVSLAAVFIVAPHVAAYWLGRDVDDLLNTTPASSIDGQRPAHGDHHD